MNDELLINDGGAYYPGTPKERTQIEQEQKALMSASYPILADVAEWFEEQIAMADSTDNIQLDLLTINGVTTDRKTSIEAQILAYRLLKVLLEDKYQQFKDFKRED